MEYKNLKTDCKSIIYGIVLLIVTILIKLINDGTLIGRCDDKRKFRSNVFGLVIESNFHFLLSLLFTGILVLLPYLKFKNPRTINYVVVLLYISAIYYPIYNLVKRLSNSINFFGESVYYRNLTEYLLYLIPAFLIWLIFSYFNEDIKNRYRTFYDNIQNKITLSKTDIILISNLVLLSSIGYGFYRGKKLNINTLIFVGIIIFINTYLIRTCRIDNFFEYFKISYLGIMIILFIVQLYFYLKTGNNIIKNKICI